MNRKLLLLCLVVFAWWTLNGLANGLDWMTMLDAQGKAVPWTKAMPASMIGAWGWAPFSLFLIWCVFRYPLDPGQLVRSFLALNLAVATVIVLRAVFIYGLDDWLHWYDAPPVFTDVLRTSVRNNLFQSWLMIGVAHALLYAQRAHQRGQQAIRLQAQLADARLSALSSQLNPHFLFNALNSVAELVHSDPEAADRMIVGLSALLRSSLDKSGTQVVGLQEELRLLGHYLDIEKVRLGKRLRVHWSVAPEALTAQVPPLLLQPLVENAVIHGISRRIAPGWISVRAFCDARDRLLLEVQNDSADSEAPGGHGIGLATTRARLECLYGDDFELDLQRGEDVGTLVRLALPLRRLKEAA